MAAPGTTVTVLDVAPASEPDVNDSVRPPTVPVIFRSVNTAAPAALVVAVGVPPSVPPPEAIAAVTTVPLVATGLPAASWSCTTGCCGKATSFWTLVEGSVVMTSRPALPAPSVIVPETAGVRPVAPKLSV